MTTMLRKSAVFGYLMGGVAASLLLTAGTADARSITAQSAQIHFTGANAAYQIEDTITWSYDWAAQPAALAAFATYFTQTTSGAPNDAQKNVNKQAAFQAPNRCAFWFGNPLQTVVSTFGPKSATATPIPPGQYDPKTGWSSQTTTGGPIEISLTDIWVASESYVENLNPSRGAAWTNKYSFDMGNDTSTSRLTQLTIELLYNDEVIDTRTLGTDFQQEVETGVDFTYDANAGQFGDSAAISKLKTGLLVSDILLADDFSGNNGLGGSRALIDDQAYTLEDEGTYTLHFTGTIKGNSATTSQGIDVSVNLVTIGGCT